MSKFYSHIHQLRARLSKLIAQRKPKRFLIERNVLEEFQNSEDRDAFIKSRLQENSFDLTKPVRIYDGITESVRLFEQ